MQNTHRALRVIALVFLASLLFSASTHNNNDDLAAKVDNIFKDFNNTNSPGGAVAIIKDGELLFSKGYGMADLEQGTRNSPSTVFHIASESKQYTAFAIMMLANEKKLALDDDIRKHLPYVPSFGKTITIRHLVNHTSGLRDQWQLLAVAGTRVHGDIITQQNVINMVKRQKALNFEPGERFVYCNTGYTLLAEVVAKVSGMSFREFTTKRIFEPLGMKNTFFHDNAKELVPNRANSYDGQGSKWQNSPLPLGTVGATSLMSTVEDASKWVLNYETGTVGGKEVVKMMHETAVLNSGKKLEYASAVIIDTYKGWQRVSHGGNDAGFNAMVMRFPEKRLGVVVYGNMDLDPTAKALAIADLFLTDNSKAAPTSDQTKPVSISEAAMTNARKIYAGTYCSDEGRIAKVTDSVSLFLNTRGKPEPATPISSNEFSFRNNTAVLTFEANGDSFTFSAGIFEVKFTRCQPYTVTADQFDSYVGAYYNSETESVYKIVKIGSSLALQHVIYGDKPIRSVTKDMFVSDLFFMSSLTFQRDPKGVVTGFEVNASRMEHVLFKKVNGLE